MAKYASDWHVPNMLHARIITSSVPHARVKRINTETLLEIEGVKALVTCLDDMTIWNDGETHHVGGRRLFADRPKYTGDCIGALASTSRQTAEEALEQIKVEYEDLPAVFDVVTALNPEAPRLWEDGNVMTQKYEFGDVVKSFANSDQFFEKNYKTARTHPAAIEPIASLAWWKENKLTVVASTQSIHGCRQGLATDLGVPLEDVRVICQYKGGGFGNRIGSMNYDLIAAILSRKTKSPVIVEYSREQDFVGLHSRWATSESVRAGVDVKKGSLLGFQFTGYSNIGAYTRRPRGTRYFGFHGDDYVPAMSVEEFNVYTNTPPSGNVRAPAGPHTNFAIETLVDEISYSLKINPLDFRINNIISRNKSQHYTSFGLIDCLKQGSEKFDWKHRWIPPPSDALNDFGDKSKSSGIGVAIGKWHARIGKGEAHVSLRRDGKIEVSVGLIDIGTGAKTTMAVIACETLNVPISDICVNWGDTDTTPFEFGESGSKTTAFVGTAVREACMKIKRKIITIAARHLGKRSEELEISHGQVESLDGKGSRLSLVRIAEISGGELMEKAVTEPVLPYDKDRASFGAHFAEVEVDLETGSVQVLEYLAIHDSGEIVNHLTAESQVKGGVVMGLGYALSEELRMDENYGSIINSNLMTYKLPSHTSVPQIDVMFVETYDMYGPKSLGEVPVLPVAPAIGNAIFNAIGIRMHETPFTSDRILLAASQRID